MAWYDNPSLLSVLKPILLRLSLQHLLREKHCGKLFNGVAKFYLSNDAELHRVNFLADTSRKSMHTSFGMMVNYTYDWEDIETNSAKHDMDGHIKTVHPIKDLMLDLEANIVKRCTF